MEVGDKIIVVGTVIETTYIQFYPPLGWIDEIRWKGILFHSFLLKNWFIGFEKSSGIPEEIRFVEEEIHQIE
jgi:hypothetical protein